MTGGRDVPLSASELLKRNLAYAQLNDERRQGIRMIPDSVFTKFRAACSGIPILPDGLKQGRDRTTCTRQLSDLPVFGRLFIFNPDRRVSPP
jgi:hypothetical protein